MVPRMEHSYEEEWGRDGGEACMNFDFFKFQWFEKFKNNWKQQSKALISQLKNSLNFPEITQLVLKQD